MKNIGGGKTTTYQHIATKVRDITKKGENAEKFFIHEMLLNVRLTFFTGIAQYPEHGFCTDCRNRQKKWRNDAIESSE